MRLQDGTDCSNCRVELCQDGMWTSVCSSQFDEKEADVICRQLGYNSTEGTSEYASSFIKKCIIHFCCCAGDMYILYKYKKHFIKILKDVGMVVPKIKETRL